jgi:ABC-type multidrug transport system fused ATPase/permease subunit
LTKIGQLTEIEDILLKAINFKSPRGQLQMLRTVLSFIPRSHKKTLLKFAVIQALTGFLDLIGIVLIGVIGSLALHGVTSSTTLNPWVFRFLELVGLDDRSLSLQVAILSSVAGFCLVGRSISAFLVSSRIFHFLGNEGALLSSTLIGKVLAKDLAQVEKATRQETVFILTSGSNKAALDVAGSLILILADMASLILIVLTLLILDVTTALIMITLFGLLSYALFAILRNKATELGRTNARLFVEINNSILKTLDNIRFIKTANLVEDRISDFNQLRYKQSKALADLSVMPYISKYFFEVVLIIGALLISALQFIMNDAIHAITTLTVFLAAGGRLAPAALRLQQSSLLIKANISYTVPVLALYKEDLKLEMRPELKTPIGVFEGRVEIQYLNYQYPSSTNLNLQDINLVIPNKSFTAIVGPSGAGKSTLVDLLLGLNTPQTGKVVMSGVSPLDAFMMWPGKVSYVPQRTNLIDGTIAENISYGRPILNDEQIVQAIHLANLEDFVAGLEDGVQTSIGELGSRLSAGQQQRIGIARALFSTPELLILDEATSALDAKTEKDLTDSLKKLRNKVTLIVVAHRLSTILDADKVVYMSNGKILTQGSMAEVRERIPEFNTQAEILGIVD